MLSFPGGRAKFGDRPCRPGPELQGFLIFVKQMKKSDTAVSEGAYLVQCFPEQLQARMGLCEFQQIETYSEKTFSKTEGGSPVIPLSFLHLSPLQQ
jgi:hypothetical protein